MSVPGRLKNSVVLTLWFDKKCRLTTFMSRVILGDNRVVKNLIDNKEVLQGSLATK